MPPGGLSRESGAASPAISGTWPNLRGRSPAPLAGDRSPTSPRSGRMGSPRLPRAGRGVAGGAASARRPQGRPLSHGHPAPRALPRLRHRDRPDRGSLPPPAGGHRAARHRGLRGSPGAHSASGNLDDDTLRAARGKKRPASAPLREGNRNPPRFGDAGRSSHGQVGRIASAIRPTVFRGQGEPSPHPSPAALGAASVPGGLSPQPARPARRPGRDPADRLRHGEGRDPRSATPRSGASTRS